MNNIFIAIIFYDDFFYYIRFCTCINLYKFSIFEGEKKSKKCT